MGADGCTQPSQAYQQPTGKIKKRTIDNQQACLLYPGPETISLSDKKRPTSQGGGKQAPEHPLCRWGRKDGSPAGAGARLYGGMNWLAWQTYHTRHALPLSGGEMRVCARARARVSSSSLNIHVLVFLGPVHSRQDKKETSNRPVNHAHPGAGLGIPPIINPAIPPRHLSCPWLTTTKRPWHKSTTSLAAATCYLPKHLPTCGVSMRRRTSRNSMANAPPVVPRGLGVQCPPSISSPLRHAVPRSL